VNSYTVSGASIDASLKYLVIKENGNAEWAPATSVYAIPNGTLTLYPDAANQVKATTNTDWNSATRTAAATSGAYRGSGTMPCRFAWP